MEPNYHTCCLSWNTELLPITGSKNKETEIRAEAIHTYCFCPQFYPDTLCNDNFYRLRENRYVEEHCSLHRGKKITKKLHITGNVQIPTTYDHKHQQPMNK